MDTNPVIALLGRRLRLAVIGGGPGSFIGAMHRAAARLDDRYELVAGVLSSDPERSRAAAISLGITPERAYADADALFSAESQRQDGADVVAAVADTGLVFCLTHNYTGYPMVRQARAMVADGQLGAIQLVQVEYVQGG